MERSPLRATLVGSYPQPDWLVDKDILRSGLVPRVSRSGMWRVPETLRPEAIRDATLLAIRDMELAGLDTISDGEIARESYSNHFAAALEGLDHERPAVVVSRAGRETRVPRVVAPIRHVRNVELDSARFLRANTRRLTKITLPGPFTLAQQALDECYHDEQALAMDFAAAVNAEAKALEAAGIDVIQLDEPWVRNDPAAARRYAVPVIDRALEGLGVRTAIHVCFGYAFMRPGEKPRAYEFLSELADSTVQEISIEAAQPNLDLGVLRELSGKSIALGVLDHSVAGVETVDVVARRIRAALEFVAPERLVLSTDCGLKYLTRENAFGQLKTMVEAVRRIDSELAQTRAS